MEQATADMLKNWTAEGGTLVTDAFFGAYRAENGLHETTIPGMGFDEVFGVSEGRIMTASQFHDAYSKEWSKTNADQTVPMKLSIDFGAMKKGNAISGYYFSEGLICKEAKPVAEFADGVCAVTLNNYQKGKAILIGSLLGGADCTQNREFLSELAQLAGVEKNEMTDTQNIRVDSLSGKVIVVCNENDVKTQCEISVSGNKLVNIITDEEIAVNNDKAQIILEHKGCECYIIQ